MAQTPAEKIPTVDGEAADASVDRCEMETPGPETILLRKTEAEALHDAMDGLPPDLREVLVLREWEGMPYKDIAQITGVPSGTVMSRLCVPGSSCSNHSVLDRKSADHAHPSRNNDATVRPKSKLIRAAFHFGPKSAFASSVSSPFRSAENSAPAG